MLNWPMIENNKVIPRQGKFLSKTITNHILSQISLVEAPLICTWHVHYTHLKRSMTGMHS